MRRPAGTGLIAPLTILYFVVGVRLPVGLVGTGMTIGGAIALMAAPLGGHFVDRAGSRRALLAGWSAAGADHLEESRVGLGVAADGNPVHPVQLAVEKGAEQHCCRRSQLCQQRVRHRIGMPATFTVKPQRRSV